MLVFPPYNISRFLIPLSLLSDHNTELLSHVQLEFLLCVLLLEFEIALFTCKILCSGWLYYINNSLYTVHCRKKTCFLVFFYCFLLALNPTEYYLKCPLSGYDFRVEILHNFVTCWTLLSHLLICLKVPDIFPSILLVSTGQPCCLSLAFLLHPSQHFLP